MQNHADADVGGQHPALRCIHRCNAAVRGGGIHPQQVRRRGGSTVNRRAPACWHVNAHAPRHTHPGTRTHAHAPRHTHPCTRTHARTRLIQLCPCLMCLWHHRRKGIRGADMLPHRVFWASLPGKRTSSSVMPPHASLASRQANLS